MFSAALMLSVGVACQTLSCILHGGEIIFAILSHVQTLSCCDLILRCPVPFPPARLRHQVGLARPHAPLERRVGAWLARPPHHGRRHPVQARHAHGEGDTAHRDQHLREARGARSARESSSASLFILLLFYASILLAFLCHHRRFPVQVSHAHGDGDTAPRCQHLREARGCIAKRVASVILRYREAAVASKIIKLSSGVL